MEDLVMRLLSVICLSLGLSACQFVNIPVTPWTVSGCWEGKSSGETMEARLMIRPDQKDDHFLIDGELTGLIDTEFKDYPVLFEDDELKAQGLASLMPVKIRADNGRLIVSSLIPPTTFTLSRCM